MLHTRQSVGPHRPGSWTEQLPERHWPDENTATKKTLKSESAEDGEDVDEMEDVFLAINSIPISVERGFSQMNMICTLSCSSCTNPPYHIHSFWIFLLNREENEDMGCFGQLDTVRIYLSIYIEKKKCVILYFELWSNNNNVSFIIPTVGKFSSAFNPSLGTKERWAAVTHTGSNRGSRTQTMGRTGWPLPHELQYYCLIIVDLSSDCNCQKSHNSAFYIVAITFISCRLF